MAKIDDAAAANAAKTDALIAKVDEAVGTLGELKVLVQTGQNTDSAEAVLAEIGTKVDAALERLSTAETDADPTPDA